MALRRTFRVAPVLALALSTAACVAEPGRPTHGPGGGPVTGAESNSTPQPRSARYGCADGSTITIENFGSSIRLRDAEGAEASLPASPPNQSSRFGVEHDAVVIDGREALIMTGGRAPLSCRR